MDQEKLEAIEQEAEEQVDEVIAKIGGQEFTASDLLSFLIEMQHWDIIEEFLQHALTEQQIEKHNIEVTQEELRERLTLFRQHNGLLSGTDMHTFLEKHHMHDQDFLEKCKFEVALDKLKEVLFQERVAEYFAHRQLTLAKMELYKISVTNEEAAKEIIETLRDGGSFFDLAHRYSQDEQTRKQCGYMGNVAIHTLDPKLQELLAASKPGSVVGPVKVAKEYLIILVGESHQAMFDGETRKLLLSELFEEHLKQMRDRGAVKTLI